VECHSWTNPSHADLRHWKLDVAVLSVYILYWRHLPNWSQILKDFTICQRPLYFFTNPLLTASSNLNSQNSEDFSMAILYKVVHIFYWLHLPTWSLICNKFLICRFRVIFFKSFVDCIFQTNLKLVRTLWFVIFKKNLYTSTIDCNFQPDLRFIRTLQLVNFIWFHIHHLLIASSNLKIMKLRHVKERCAVMFLSDLTIIAQRMIEWVFKKESIKCK